MREFEFTLDFGCHDYPPTLRKESDSDGTINEKFTEDNVSIFARHLHSDDSFSGGWCAIGTYILTAGINIGLGLISAWLYDKIKKKNATAIYLNQYYLHLGEKKIKNLNTGKVSELINEEEFIKKLIEESTKSSLVSRCAGLKSNGQRCKRKVKEKKFCFNHKINHNALLRKHN